MLAALQNMLKVEDLRKKLIYTLLLIALVRLVQNIPLPGINIAAFQAKIASSLDGGGKSLTQMFNVFSGGALQKCAIGVLGIMPFITASIIMQLMTPVVPQLEKMQKESEQGRQQIQQITRYLTILICVVQGGAIAMGAASGDLVGIDNPILIPKTPFVILAIILFTGSALLIMWLGEMISEKGLGNGASLIITISIISNIPSALTVIYDKFMSDTLDIVQITLLVALFIAVTYATVALVEGLRKIPIKYARRTVGSRTAAAQQTYLPLKVNHAGVMPIIFAGALMMVPSLLVAKFNLSWLAFAQTPSHPGSILLMAAMIMIFTFFWVATQFNPIQVADDLKNSGGFIPGYHPGDPTAAFLNQTMTRITTAGAVFLTALAVFPTILGNTLADNNQLISQFFGGTSLLIMVGVVLQTMQQVEVQLVQHNYDGLVDAGKLRNRSATPAVVEGE